MAKMAEEMEELMVEASETEEPQMEDSQEIKDSQEKDPEVEDADSRLVGIQGFDTELLDAVKSGFEPLFVGHPTTTIYTVPRTINNVAPDQYKVRYTTFAVDNDFDKVYPRENFSDLHMAAHVHSILSRNPETTYEDYVAAMNVFSERIEKCHLIKIQVDFQRLVALVYSACHIVDNFLLHYEGKLTINVDEICTTGLQDLWIDMLLLENQVPFFSLQQVFDMAVVDKTKFPSLVELCLLFFRQFVEFSQEKPLLESGSVHHLLHLVHYHMVPHRHPEKSHSKQQINPFFTKLRNVFFSCPYPVLPITQRQGSVQPLTIKPMPSARRLQDAGIKFRKKKGKGFMDITFQKGVLEIPYLRIDSNTEALLRNLIAWEQCHLVVGGYFTSYAIFMDCLINTAKDVEILNHSGIIEHSVGSEEEVASIFNGLGTNVAYIAGQNNFLPQLCKDLNDFCQSRYRIWWANLMTDYFSNPWAIISVVAGIFLLGLTTTQTFYTVYGYYKSN